MLHCYVITSFIRKENSLICFPSFILFLMSPTLSRTLKYLSVLSFPKLLQTQLCFWPLSSSFWINYLLGKSTWSLDIFQFLCWSFFSSFFAAKKVIKAEHKSKNLFFFFQRQVRVGEVGNMASTYICIIFESLSHAVIINWNTMVLDH